MGWFANAFAQVAKPDFTGTWKLNSQKSFYDNRNVQDLTPDRVYLLTVTQGKNSLTESTKAEGVTNPLDATYQIDGKFKVEKQGDHYRYTKASWEGTTLVLEISDRDSKKETAKFLLYIRESWTLSFDGKVMTQLRRTAQGAKIIDQKYVMDKQ